MFVERVLLILLRRVVKGRVNNNLDILLKRFESIVELASVLPSRLLPPRPLHEPLLDQLTN